MLTFKLLDARDPSSTRILVSLSAPRRAEGSGSATSSLYVADLTLGADFVPVRQVFGLSPVECLACALTSIDATLRHEHERAPLSWEDGRTYGGDYDIPIQLVVERQALALQLVLDSEAAARGRVPPWPGTTPGGASDKSQGSSET